MKPTLLFEIVWLWNFQIDIWLIIDWKIVRPKFLFEMCLWQDSVFQKLVLDWLKKLRFTIIDWYLFGNSFKIENCLKLFEYCYKPIEIVWNYIYYPFLNNLWFGHYKKLVLLILPHSLGDDTNGGILTVFFN